MSTALTVAKLSVSASWVYRHIVTGLRNDDKSDSLTTGVSMVCDSSHATDPYFIQSTLAPSSSVTFNLATLAEQQFGKQLASTRAYVVVVTMADAPWSFAPAGGNPVSWFLSGTISWTPTSGVPDVFAFGSQTPVTIDATHKQVTITNLSASVTLTYTMALFLGEGP